MIPSNGMAMRHLGSALAAALFAVTAVSACSSSSSSTAASGGSSSGAAASYTVMTWNSYTSQSAPAPGVLPAANAAVDAINAAGGVAGRKVKLITCDDQFDPNKTVACAREAVHDKVSAVVGASTILDPADVYRVLAQGDIPYIGGNGITPDELQSKITFSVAGAAGQFYGLVAALKTDGDTKIAVVKCEVSNCDNGAQYVTAAAARDQVTVVRQVTAPLATTDYTAAAATTIRGGVNGVVFVGSPQQSVPLVRALDSQGFRGNFAVADVELPPNYLSALGSDARNILVVYDLCAPTDTSYPGVVKFEADMKKYAPGAPLTTAPFETWWAFQLFAAIAPKAKSTSGGDILMAAKNLKTGSVSIGVGPALPVGTSSPLAKYPGLAFDPDVAISSVADRKIGPSHLIDPFSG